MNRQLFVGRKILRIPPCGYQVARGRIIMSTLLGSCVAACLYDPENGVAGMNHFMLSNRRYAREMPFSITEAGRYGIHAMELLINALMRHGARRANLRAKAFGGASIFTNRDVVGNFSCVGSVNCRFIREFLDNEGIPLVASDLGGERGRVIYFDGGDYSVYVRRMSGRRNIVVAERDRSLWQQSVEEHDREAAGIDLWLPGQPRY